MLALALEATAAFGLRTSKSAPATSRCSRALIDALDLYPVWRRRLIKDFNRKVSLAQDLERLTLATAPSATNMRACSRRSPAPIARRRWRWSPT